MSRLSRRVLAVATVLALVALPATGAAAQTPEGVGTATTNLQLLGLEADGLPLVGDLLSGIDLGSLLSYASNDTNTDRNARGNGQPFALSQLLLAGDHEFTARSDGQTQTGGQSAALPAGAGAVSVGNLSAVVEDGEALSLVDALSGSLTGLTNLTGIGVALPESGAQSRATGVQTASQNGAVLNGVELSLGDLLPADLLSNLPLDVLLALLEDLNLEGLLGGGVSLDNLTDIVGGIDNVTGLLQGLPVDLDALLGVLDTLTAVVDGGGGDLTELKNLLDGAVCGLPILAPTLCGQLDDITEVSELLNLTELELLNLLEGDLLGTVTGLLNQLVDLVTGLVGLLSNLDLGALLDGLLGAEILSIDTLTMGVASVAGQDASASAVCNAAGISILGAAVPLEGCDTVGQVSSGLLGTVTGLLNNLPIVGNVTGGLINVGGLEVVEEVTTNGDFQVSRAAVTPLTLGLDLSSLGLGNVTSILDGLVGDLGVLDGLLGGLLPVGSASAASAGAQAAQLPALPVDLGDLVGSLTGLLGGDLGGLGLPSIEIQGPGMESVSNFGPAAGHTTPIEEAKPSSPTPSDALPRTGGSPTGFAIALMGAAGVAFWVARGRRLNPLAFVKGGSGRG